MTTEQKLGLVLLTVWDAFLEGSSLDGFDLEKLLERSGLTEWRNATEEEARTSTVEVEAGEPLMFLTDEGQKVIQQARHDVL